jgi:dienelactone hydrolase
MKGSHLGRRRVLAGFGGLAVMVACPHLRAQPDAAAARAPEVHDLDWHDAPRERPVPVRLWLPAAAGAPRPVPLVVFSHGIGGSRRGYSYLGRHFAEGGVASLHVQHVGSDNGLWRGNVFSLVGRLQGAAQEAEAIARVADLRFAIDALGASPFAARIDTRRVCAAGHSYGANTTLLAAGARVPPVAPLASASAEGGPAQAVAAGDWRTLREPRLSGAVVISAPPFYGHETLAPILGEIALPSLHVTATEDVINIPGYHSGLADRLAVFDAIGSAGPEGGAGRRKWLAVFQGGSHSIFTDRAGTGGTALNPQVKAATRELALAFVQQLFDLDPTAPRALAEWPRRHAGIVARFAAPA